MMEVGKECGCPVVSVLEGGYNLAAITESAVGMVRAMVEAGAAATTRTTATPAIHVVAGGGPPEEEEEEEDESQQVPALPEAKLEVGEREDGVKEKEEGEVGGEEDQLVSDLEQLAISKES